MDFQLRRNAWLLLSLLGLLSILPLGWLTFVLLVFIPGFSLASLFKEKFTLAEIVAIPLTLSILAIPMAAMVSSPLPFHATSILLGLTAAIIGLYNYWKNRALSIERSGRSSLIISVFIFLIVLIISLKTFHIQNGELFYTYTHGLDQDFHLSIAQRYIAMPQIPPQDPYIAGYSIAYDWFMHVMLGEISIISGIGLLDVFKVVVAIASALIFLDTYLLAMLIFKSDNKAALGAALLYILSAGLSWIYILYNQFPAASVDLFNSLVYQWPGITLLKYDPTSLYFFLPQPQTFGLLAMIFCFYLFILNLRSKSMSIAAITGLSLASLIFYHLTTAAPVLATMGVWSLYEAIKAKNKWTLLKLTIPLAIGGIAIFVQYLILPTNAGSQIALGHHPDVLITLLAALGPLLLFAMYGIYKTWDNDGVLPLALFAAVNLLFVNIFTMDVTNNTYRFLTYLSLPVSLFAGYVLTNWMRSKKIVWIAAAVIIVLVMVPSTLMIVNFYIDAPMVSLASPMDVNAIYWIKNNTPPNAVIYENPDPFPRVPILSGRNDLYAGETYVSQYHGIDWFDKANAILYIDDPGVLHTTLSQYGVNYVLVGGKELDFPFAAEFSNTTYFKSVYDQDGFEVYEVIGVPIKPQ